MLLGEEGCGGGGGAVCGTLLWPSQAAERRPWLLALAACGAGRSGMCWRGGEQIGASLSLRVVWFLYSAVSLFPDPDGGGGAATREAVRVRTATRGVLLRGGVCVSCVE